MRRNGIGPFLIVRLAREAGETREFRVIDPLMAPSVFIHKNMNVGVRKHSPEPIA